MPANPRQIAYDLLAQVATENAYANLLMPKLLKAANCSGRDAAFATELGFGALRMRGLLDEILPVAADRSLDRIDPPLRDVLRLGAYQALFMRVPPHAAVSTTVDLAAAIGHTSAKGFVNATMRRITERDLEEWQALATEAAPDELSKLAIRYSHPRWQVAALKDALAADASELAELLAKNNTAPRVTGVSRCGQAGVDELLAAGGELGNWSPRAVSVLGDPAELAGVRAGRLAVQDEGSQLVALALAYAPIAGADQNWLDLCAGPGGKAALLAAESAGLAVRLTAVELQASRAELVRKSLATFADRTKVIQADGTDPQFATGDFDRVLVDAPCTGLGVLRRRPESRWRRQPGDVGALGKLQRALLRNALAAVRPGGVVGYATCSPHLAETEFVVEDLLRQTSGARLLDAVAITAAIPGLRQRERFVEITAAGPYLRLWPHRHDTDGMFLALITRD